MARKALILACGLGWRLALEDVAITGLYPAEMAACSVAEFMEREPPSLDAESPAGGSLPVASGKVLRYVAAIADGRCTVGRSVVEANSPLGHLRGADNLVEFHTGWYQPMLLVIQGRGAVSYATAAGGA